MKEIKKSIIFDFDGVIAPTNLLKTEILTSCVKDIIGLEAAKDFANHHKNNGGISRFVKFRRIIEKYNKNDQAYENLIKEAKLRIDESLLQISYEDGFFELISYLNKFNIECSIISGAPTEDLQLLIKKWEVETFFSSVLGSPTLKKDHFLEYRKKHHKEQIICIGDSPYDLECANTINAKFVLIYKYSENQNFVKNYTGIKFSSLINLYNSDLF